jgi:hypothetical protein
MMKLFGYMLHLALFEIIKSIEDIVFELGVTDETI